MRAVRIHLNDALVARVPRPVESREVGGTEAPLARAMEHVNARIRGREPVGDRAGTVRTGVVDDEQVDIVDRGEKMGCDARQASRFVVGRHDDEHPAPA